MEPFKGFAIGNYATNGKLIGKGSFADVYLGHPVDSPTEYVAIKVISKSRLIKLNPKHMQQMESEIRIMKTLYHENIVNLNDVYVDADYIYLVLEYCEGGDLSSYLKKHKPLSEDTARYFLRQLAAGLQYLDSKNIVHRDLKPHNLLLAPTKSRSGGLSFEENSQSSRLKIADFGFARHLEPQSLANTMCGTPLYMAPEIFLRSNYNSKADLWSVGVILFEMVFGTTPFTGANHIELADNVRQNPVKFPDNIKVSPECKDLLQSLLRKNEKERITLDEVSQHPFMIHDINAFKTSASLSISLSQSGHRKRSYTTGSAPRDGDDNYVPPSSTPMPTGSLNRESNFASPPPPSSLGNAAPPTHYYQPLNYTPLDRGHNGINHFSPPLSSTPLRNASGDINPSYLRSPSSSGGFTDAHGSGGWGVRKPITNPFKESFETPSNLTNPKEKGSTDHADRSFDMTTKSDLAHASPEEITDQLESLANLAPLVIGMADKWNTSRPVDALALYVKALQIYSSVANSTKKALQSHTLTGSSRLGQVMERIVNMYKQTLHKAETLRRKLHPSETCPPAEKCIYEAALRKGREGAVAEGLSNFEEAESLYLRSSQLLQLLLLSSDTSHASDKGVLKACMWFPILCLGIHLTTVSGHPCVGQTTNLWQGDCVRSAKRYPPPATRELEENWGKFPFPKSEKVENMVRKKKLDRLSEPRVVPRQWK